MANKKSFNDYKINGKTVYILLENKKGASEVCVFDLKNLQKLIDFDHCWHLFWSTKTKSYYAKCTAIVNGKSTSVYMHRFLLGIENGNDKIYGDHINHNALDNRMTNLQVVDNIYNNINRSGANSNNKTGKRNICRVGEKLFVQLQVDGKNKVLGKFELDEMEKAEVFAEKMRNKYYSNIPKIR